MSDGWEQMTELVVIETAPPTPEPLKQAYWDHDEHGRYRLYALTETKHYVLNKRRREWDEIG